LKQSHHKPNPGKVNSSNTKCTLHNDIAEIIAALAYCVQYFNEKIGLTDYEVRLALMTTLSGSGVKLRQVKYALDSLLFWQVSKDPFIRRIAEWIVEYHSRNGACRETLTEFLEGRSFDWDYDAVAAYRRVDLSSGIRRIS